MKYRMSAGIVLLFMLPMALAVAQEQAAVKSLQIADAKLGKEVRDREIVPDTTGFTVNDRVYLWLRVVGGPSDSLTVTWKVGDETHMAKLNIGGSPWRTWAYKTAYKAGNWTVSVSDASGNVLKEMSFTVEEMK